MAISVATGFPVNQSGVSTISVTWKTGGDQAILTLGNFSNSTDHPTAISSANTSGWAEVCRFADATDGWNLSMWMGKITSAVADTVTVTWTSTPAGGEIVTWELVPGVGSPTWSAITTGNLRTTASPWNFPSLTSGTVTDQCYIGYQATVGAANDGTNGATFTYHGTANSNESVVGLGLATSTAYQPVSGPTGTGPMFAIGAILTPDAVGAPFRPPPPTVVGQGSLPSSMTGIMFPPHVTQAVRRAGTY